MSTIFGESSSSLIRTPGDDRAKLAVISVHGAGGASTAKLPLISINEMSHHNRQQLDCSLDGTIHVLAAAGGLGICTMTFMDRVSNCAGGSERSLSALHQYGKMRKKMAGANVTVRILGSNGSTTLATFKGIVKSCTASAQHRQGMDVLLVTYSMHGVMNCGE